MGAGASATASADASKQIAGASSDDVRAALIGLGQEQRRKLQEAIARARSGTGEAPSAAASAAPATSSSADAGAKDGDAGAAAAASAASSSGAAVASADEQTKETEDADADTGGPDDIPEAWGWPKEAYDAGILRQYVLEYTKATKQEEWDEALAARSVGGTLQDHITEKAFANLMLNKEGTGEVKDGKEHQGVDIRAYKKGKWYKFMNAKGDCWMYVHNYTLDVQCVKPENFGEMTEEEKARLKKLGVFIKELPGALEVVYDKQKQIPIVFGSQDTCEALKVFAMYAKEWQLLDCTKLKRVNGKALDESRKAIVNAMKQGKWLCVYLGDVIPDLQEKICISKNRDTFPLATFTYGGLASEMVKDNIYRDDDREANMCVERAGFRVCVVLQYDSMVYEMSSFRKEDMKNNIPNFHHMEQVRCYAEHDVKKILSS